MHRTIQLLEESGFESRSAEMDLRTTVFFPLVCVEP